MRRILGLAPVLALALLYGCGSTNFASGGASGKKDKDSRERADTDETDSGDGPDDLTDTQKGEDGGGDSGSDTGDRLGGAAGDTDTGEPDAGGPDSGEDVTLLGAATSDIVADDGEIIACPKKAQKVLILDFKSGWWAGDGGAFFDKVLSHLHKQCPAEVVIEYHHLLKPASQALPPAIQVLFPGLGQDDDPDAEVHNSQVTVPGGSQLARGGSTFETAFGDASWKSYSQIWLLSGAREDPLDFAADDAFFQKVVKKMGSSSAHVFLGAGYGSIVHANAAAAALSLGTPFGTSSPEDRILDPMRGITVTSTLKRPKLGKSILFSKIDEIADEVRVAQEAAVGDFLSASESISIVAEDTKDRGSIAVSKPVDGGRKVVLDAGLQRYYSVWEDESPGTMQLLQNIIVYLNKK